MLPGLAIAYFLLLWLPGWLGSYGTFIDEFYYIACSRHLALGYVDHPPLSILLLSGLRAVAGDSLPVLRLVPALAGAMSVLITGKMARQLGAGAFGQTLAAMAVMVSPVYHVVFGFYSMNALSALLVAACFWTLIEIERRGEPRLWILFGLLVGVGLESKHTMILLVLGLAVALAVTPARRHLATRWPWIALAAALFLFAPNLVWQAAHGWPSIEFYKNADLYKNVPTPPLEILKQQVLFMNPGAAPVWLAGLGFFLFTRRGRPFRHLSVIYAALLLLMLAGQKSRPDRITDFYTPLFAGGGVLLGEICRRRRLAWLRWTLPLVLLASGAALAPLGLPILPPAATARYAAALGIVPQIESGEGKRSELPQWLADRLGWEQLVDDVTAVAGRFDPAERGRAIILAPTYGQAGAIELLGRGRDLPPVYATQNSYFHWGPPDDPVETAIVLGPFGEATVRRLFEEVELAAVHDCEWCMAWRDRQPIWLARRPKVRLRDAWPFLKHYE